MSQIAAQYTLEHVWMIFAMFLLFIYKIIDLHFYSTFCIIYLDLIEF